MSAHPSIQDLSSEAELVSHDISPLPSVGYRQHACISDSWRPQAGLGSRHDGIRSAPSCICQDTLMNLSKASSPFLFGCGLHHEDFKTQKLAPEAGLEPAIALVKGKCLNHLNYSGRNNCCMRLFFPQREGGLEWLTGFEPATFWMAIKCSTNWATATYNVDWFV